ncbi:hypothetical protein HZC08_00565 [Candidatus Micrarchaeota archaeon]|nr:hypothetical protein [Candidatus Micrarchaeota archaeon]
MEEYNLEFDEEWIYYFNRLENDLKDRIKKKLTQLKYLPSRHLEHGIDFHVKEIG